jgi:flagellin-specific chaperone FliS
MRRLSDNPAGTYRRVDVEARIEASSGAELTRLCLEELVAAVGRAILVLERGDEANLRQDLTRAHTIATWLAQNVAPGHPLADQLGQFYGGLAAQIGASLARPEVAILKAVRGDVMDLLNAARQG